MKPYTCPVCQGRGAMPYSFYSPPTPGTSFGGFTFDVACRSCGGTGIVWRGDDDTEGQPAQIEPPKPLTPSTGTTVTVTSAPSTNVSFTALQGAIPAGRRECSIDPRYLNGGY